MCTLILYSGSSLILRLIVTVITTGGESAESRGVFVLNKHLVLTFDSDHIARSTIIVDRKLK